MKLRDVLPREFFQCYMTTLSSWPNPVKPSPAALLLDAEISVDRSRTVVVDGRFMENPEWKPWPGTAKNVQNWWELANGKAVAWNESPSHGWSFPVISLKRK